jgi:CheY-like chemotaxis protein
MTTGKTIGKKILIVDDDGDLREFVQSTLVDAGFQVASVADAPSALAHMRRQTDLDLVITDIVMPDGMDGCALGQAIRLERPDLKIIYMSGYPHDQCVLPNEEFIAKPFRPHELLGCVYEILGRDDPMRGGMLSHALRWAPRRVA